MRCRVLVHLIDGTSPDPLGDYDAINLEMKLFDPDLAVKPQIVVYNKMDCPDSSDYWDEIQDHFKGLGVPVYSMSAIAGTGIKEVVRAVRKKLEELPEPYLEPTVERNYGKQILEKKRSDRLDDFQIIPRLYDRTWIVEGAALERFCQMTKWNYFESIRRFHAVLEASGCAKQLRKRGIKEGDTVWIGEVSFEWQEDTDWGEVADVLRNQRGNMGAHNWPH